MVPFDFRLFDRPLLLVRISNDHILADVRITPEFIVLSRIVSITKLIHVPLFDLSWYMTFARQIITTNLGEVS